MGDDVAKMFRGIIQAEIGRFFTKNDRTHTMLLGGFHCCLSCDEKNQWHEFTSVHPVYQELQKLEERLNALTACGNAVDINECQNLYSRRNTIHSEMYAIGKEWYAGIVAARET